MQRDTATPQAWTSLVQLWLFAMQHGEIAQVRYALAHFRGGDAGRITRLTWSPL